MRFAFYSVPKSAIKSRSEESPSKPQKSILRPEESSARIHGARIRPKGLYKVEGSRYQAKEGPNR